MGARSFSFRIVLFITGTILMASSSFSQTTPLYFWNFQEANQRDLEGLQESYQIQTEGSNSYIRLKEGAASGRLPLGQDLPPTFSLSFWIRFPENTLTSESRLFWTADNALSFRIYNTSLVFVTRSPGRNGSSVKDSWIIPLDGSDFASYDILENGGWHQLTIQYNHRSGKKSLYIDGRQLESWNKVASHTGKLCGANGCNQSLMFNHLRRTNQLFQGDLAQVSVYNRSLSREEIASTFSTEARNFGRARALQTSSSAQPTTQRFDLREFAPSGISAETQLFRFPRPRFLPGHTLRPNFNWVDPVFLSGFRITDDSPQRSAARMSRMQEELWMNWNYTLSFSANLGYKLKANRNAEHIQALIRLANKHPDLPIGLITLWGNVQPVKLGGTAPVANIRTRTFPPEYYFRRSNGTYFNTHGQSSAQPKNFSPASPMKLWKEDGENQGELLKPILNQLTRQVNYVNENGEVQPFPMEPEILEKDADVVAIYRRSGFSSWEEFMSDWKTSMRKSYRDGYMDHPRLRNAHFSWYGVDGGPYNLDRFNWKIAREAMYPINGQYYSTPNFYVRKPDNWRKWNGPWRGWEWISISRKVEIAAGDKLFSPFVAAGWSKKPEENVRPSQWLGLLKCLGVAGAEFYYAGVFNERNVSNFPIPENYVWQLTTPAYAQAITSRYEEILREGDLITDEEGIPILEYDAGDLRILFTARKHNLREEYILAGTIQPSSNVAGTVPDVANASVVVNGMELRLPVRRQGSVYHLIVEGENGPVIRHLDAWHETGHPGFWTENFHFEAEVNDFMQDCKVVTTGNQGMDFTNARTHIIPSGENPCVKFAFTPHETGSYALRISASSRNGSGKVTVMINDRTAGEIVIPEGEDFVTSEKLFSALRNLPADQHLLSIMIDGDSLSLDSVTLVKQ